MSDGDVILFAIGFFIMTLVVGAVYLISRIET